jgi:putative membrane protein
VNRLKDYILIFAKGMCMGATEVAHGVSGSTMALILGVYHEFIRSLRAIDREAWALLRKQYFAEYWKKINGGFLLTLCAGMICSAFSLAQLLAFLLRTYFIETSALLFGLILISGVLLLRKVRKWTFRPVFALFGGILINYSLTIFEPWQSPDNAFLAPFAGIFAGLSLAIPGISSAFILIIVGKYQYIVTSFTHFDPVIIGLFFLGCVAGMWFASRFMYRILADYYNTTIALLAGLMLGALNKLWPWRKVLEYITNGKGEQVPSFDQSVLPWKYTALTGKDPHIFPAILMMAVGVLIVVLIEKIAAGLKTKI